MDLKIILIYCICSDFLKNFKYQNPNYQMTDAEVLTFAIVAAMFFYGNHERSRHFLKFYGYIPNMLSKSQLNRRLHTFDDSFWNSFLYLFSKSLLHFEKKQEYIVDSFPLSACDTSRISRAKIYRGKDYHGYSPTKQRYFYGIKVHMITSTQGVPIELLFTPGSEHDMRAFKRFSLDLPEGSIIYGDRAYNNYDLEDFLKEHMEIEMIVQRRSMSKRTLSAERRYVQSRMRKRIETVFSQITKLFPRTINAVTSSGFEIKIFNFILAYTFELFFKSKLALT